MRLLVALHSPDLSRKVASFLESVSYSVEVVSRGDLAYTKALTNRYDLLIFSSELPYLDGCTLCRKLRREESIHTPVILLSEQKQLDYCLKSFAAGADDYLIKPFSLLELVARCRALLRRHQLSTQGEVLQVANLYYDSRAYQLSREGKVIELSAIPLRLVEYLMRISPEVATQYHLQQLITENGAKNSALRTHIHQIRQKIDKPFSYPLLHTIHGVGYRLAKKDAALSRGKLVTNLRG